MRIPSQFNQDNLYRRDRPRVDSNDSLRRIIRMAVALVLLIFVMRQAAEPKNYEVFFGEAPELTTESAGSPQAAIPAGPVTQQQRVKDLPIDDACIAVTAALVDAMPANERRQWTTVLARWNSGEPFPLVDSLATETSHLLSDIAGIDPAERDRWRATLEKFGEIYGDNQLATDSTAPPTSNQNTTAAAVANDAAGPPDTAGPSDAAGPPDTASLSDKDAVRLVAWLTALDSAALQQVVDGVWRSSDFDAFYLQLDQAASLRTAGAMATSVVPLLQQPDVYRGQRVRVSGVIARAEKRTASANPHGIESYWQLWVMAGNGGDRPMVFVVPDLPAKIEQTANAGGQPRAQLVGRFFKRLAYRSQLGADLAPVVIGRVITPRQNPLRSASTSSAANSSDRQQFLVMLLVASAIGIALATIAMWRTSVAARRSRELRARRQPPGPSLGNLSQADFQDEVDP